MKPFMIDTHAHLDMQPFDGDRQAVIGRALEAGVKTMIAVGIDLRSSQKVIELAEKYGGIFAAAGIHPHEAASVKREDIDAMAKLVRQPKVVAVGEMGLDFYRNRSPRESQFKVLEWQLALADEAGLPVIIHSRQADREMVAVLKRWTDSRKRQSGDPAGVIHCFNSDAETAKKYIDMGFYIAFGAYIGYTSSFRLNSTIKGLPSDRFMVETDCPFLPPQQYRGKRNEPAYIPITVSLLAQIRQVSFDVVAQQTTENARRLFRLPASE